MELTLKQLITRDIKKVVLEGKDLSETFDVYDVQVKMYPNDKELWLLNDTFKKVIVASNVVTDTKAREIINNMALNIVLTVGSLS